jgi:enoyl-CoA hydratase
VTYHKVNNNQIAVITINRPEVKNAIDRSTATQLAARFREFEQDKEALVSVLCGNQGDDPNQGSSFCTGADLKAIYRNDYNRLEDEGEAPLGPSRFQVSKPVIAAISGYAVAGGLELACLCDLRVMEEDAVLGVFCRRWGVPLIDGGTVRLPRLIGLSRAMDLILTGRAVDAKEAHAIGLANRVVPKGKSLEEAIKLASLIASFPQDCMLADRKSAYEQHHLSVPAALKQEFAGGKPIALHQLKEGVAKFNSRTRK